jgi:general secretion pathway protein G
MDTLIVRQNRRSGFTLVELMLVMVILAILATLVTVEIAGRRKQAMEKAAKADIAQLDTALDMFEVDCGRFPTADEGFQALVIMPGNIPEGSWHGPYVKRGLPKDPWGNAYVYVAPGQHNMHYDVYTTRGGEDSGGNGINNWSNSSASMQ